MDDKKERLQKFQKVIEKYRKEKELERKEHPERFTPQWSYELFGVECGEGWKGLYQPIIDYISKYNEEHDDKFEIHQIKEKFGCYDGETFVLTKTGWKLFKDITYDDEIMTLGKNDKIEYYKPTDIVSYKYRGKMYKLENRGIDLLVTPNHNLYVSNGSYFNHKKNNFKRVYDFELTTPEKYFRKDKRFKKGGAKWDGVECYNFVIKETKEPRPLSNKKCGTRVYSMKGFECDINHFLKFLGFYVAEGCSSIKKSCVSLAYNALDEEELVESILNGIGVKYKDKTIGSGGLKKIYHKNLSKWLFENCGHFAWNKRVPDFVKNLPPQQIRIFLEYIFIGDGHKSKTSNILTTTSRQLADDVEELLIKCGDTFREYKKRLKKNINKHNRIISKHEIYEINWLKLNDIEVDMSKAKKCKSFFEDYIEYNDYVYCVTVPNHVIYIRRNGKGCWCGNSLRFYVNKYNDELRQMIRDAEDKSYHTCEVCGKYIDKPINENYWIYAECEECHNKWKENREKAMEVYKNNIKEKNIDSESS